MQGDDVMRDERTIAVENQSYRAAYLLLSFGLLVSTAYRAFGRGEASWDLLGLVILGGVVSSVYQGHRQVLTRRWAWQTVVVMVVAAVIAVAIVIVGR